MATSIIQANVMHQRLRPLKHRFVYPVFMLKLDLDDVNAGLLPTGALFGINRWRPISFHTKDYGPRDGTNLKTWAMQILHAHQINGVQKIELLSFPRVFGYAFNPISIWYCYDEQSQLKAVLAEVNNTFGEHHFYLLSASNDEAIGANTTLTSNKMLHVSPFCEVKGHYQFAFAETSKKIKVKIDYHDEGDVLLQTAVTGKVQQFTTRHLLFALGKQPLLTIGVFFRIHWHALLLWLKRVPFQRQIHFTNQQITTGKSIEQEQTK